MLPQEDIDRLRGLRVDYTRYVSEFESKRASGEEKFDWRSHVVECKSLAVATWLLDGDLSKTRSIFACAGEAVVQLIRSWVEAGTPYWSKEVAMGMECALISGNMVLAKTAAELLENPEAYVGGRSVVGLYARGLRNMIVGDHPSAREDLGSIAQTRKQPYQQLGKLYIALLDRDDRVVEKELKAHIQWFTKNAKPEEKSYWFEGKTITHRLIPFEFYLSVPGLAFCNMACRHGMSVGVDDEPFLPRELYQCTT